MEPLVALRSRRGPAAERAAVRGGLIDVGLVLTHACNLACTYCYTGEKKRVRMTPDLAERALDFAFATAGASDSRLQLEFFGGEPLLEPELLLAVAESARARAAADGRTLLLQVTTNGTRLTAELVDRLAALGVHVALSIDGTRAQHEAGRPLAGGGSSYDATRRGLDLLVAASDRLAFDVISVVDPCNVGALGDGLAELVESGVEAVTLNVNWGARWDEASLAALERGLEAAAAVFLAWLRAGRWIRIQPIESALRSHADLGRIVTASCSAGARRLAVAPSGRIYPCARAVGEDDGRAAIGHVDTGIAEVIAPAEHGCRCANVEETGDPMLAGATRIRHDRAIAEITERLAARLSEEFERIVVTERAGPA